jgi:hypothetical protein
VVIADLYEETGKLYYFNKYLKGQIQILEQGSKTKKPELLAPISFRCLKYKNRAIYILELPTFFLFEILMSSKAPWMGRGTKRMKDLSRK